MNSSKKMKAAALVIGSSVLMAAGSATAANVEANGGFQSRPSVWSTTDVTGSVNGSSLRTGWAGIASFTRTGSAIDTAPEILLTDSPSGLFYAICLEFNEFLEGGSKDWDLKALSAAPIDADGSKGVPMGARSSDMAKLLNGVYSSWGSTPVSTLFTTALQLAVWEIANEDKEGSAYNLTASTGRIYFTNDGQGGAAISLAQGWLGQIGTVFTDDTQYYRALTKDGAQDFLVKVVPIPAAAWLLGSGLLGLFGLARRKKAAAAA
jgi:hypothetical protein